VDDSHKGCEERWRSSLRKGYVRILEFRDWGRLTIRQFSGHVIMRYKPAGMTPVLL